LDDTITEVCGSEGILGLHTHLPGGGVLDDKMESLIQEKTLAKINPALLERALTVCDEVCFQENCTIARRGENLLVLSANAA
jgi:hypothetical protein